MVSLAVHTHIYQYCIIIHVCVGLRLGVDVASSKTKCLSDGTFDSDVL